MKENIVCNVRGTGRSNKPAGNNDSIILLARDIYFQLHDSVYSLLLFCFTVY